MRASAILNMARKILCVAEKPSIAKTVAQHLGGGQVQTVRVFSCEALQALTKATA